LGISYLETGDTAEAIRNFQRAAQQDQGFTAAFIELGSLLQQNDPGLAASYLENAIAADSSNLQVMYNLGLLYQQLLDTAKAEAIYKSILASDSSFFLASYNLGYLYLMYGDDLQQAITFFDHTLRMNPGYVDALYNRGLCFEILGNYGKARLDYTEALRRMPDYSRAIEGMNRLDEHLMPAHD
jgi:tetratricopeptide (TPR) repeat protein